MVIHGPPGVGKTEFAAHFPGAGFIYDPQEPGIVDLMEYNKVKDIAFAEEADSWESTLSLIEKVATKKLRCNTLVFDSITGFEKLCFLYHCREHFENDWSDKGFYAFQRGPKNAAKTDWPGLFDSLNDCIVSGVNVILLAHTQTKPYSNPEGPDYDRHTPYMDKDMWQVVNRWAKAVLFYNFSVTIEKKGIGKAKAKNDVERHIYTEWAAAYDAKNRYGLPDLIEAGDSGKEAYDNFEKAFRKAIS